MSTYWRTPRSTAACNASSAKRDLPGGRPRAHECIGRLLDILEVVSAEMIEFSAPGIAVATNGHRLVET
jgi:hypothetical protein